MSEKQRNELKSKELKSDTMQVTNHKMVEVLVTAGADDLVGDQPPVLLASEGQALLHDVGGELVVAHAHHAPGEFADHRGSHSVAPMLYQLLHHVVPELIR